MRETLAQNAGIVWALLGALFVICGLFVIALRRRRRTRRVAAVPSHPSTLHLVASVVTPKRLDSAELTAAVRDAETNGQHEKLPELYFSLAKCRIEAGEASDAEELLRKCIRGAARLQRKVVHARARVALGDLAHDNGDATTACEHWQIARALYFELKQSHDHDAVEMRMLKNGCPTDWVLTDF